jgi:hypothetical protein
MELHSGEVTPGFREASDVWLCLEFSGLERNDGDGSCMLEDRPRNTHASYDNYARIGLYQLRRKRRQILGAPVGKPGINRQVLTLDIPEDAQILEERRQVFPGSEFIGFRALAQIADYVWARGLLRLD